MGWGQEQFQLLLQGSAEVGDSGVGGTAGATGSATEKDGLEELRYRWMLYKAKLKDVGDLRARLNVKVRASE